MLQYLPKVDYQRPATTPPPKTLVAFIKWAISGAWPLVIWASIFSALAGVVEMASSLVLGWVIDRTITSTPQGYIIENMGLLTAAVIFFLIFRPIVFWISAVFQNYIVVPGITNLILLRIHRWTMGHAVTFFDNDFAGRISQKEMQTTNSLTNAISEFIHAIVFALASVLATVFILGALDFRMAIAVAVWMALYAGFLAYFIPKARMTSKTYADSRSVLVGQIVDVISNIRTLKLFAQSNAEDASVVRSMHHLYDKGLARARVILAFRFWLMMLAGIFPVVLVGLAISGWRDGSATLGDIATAGAISLRVITMTGWVSFTIMGIYGNIGELEDGIRTLTPDHTMVDAPDATTLTVTQADVRFDAVDFQYGQQNGGVTDLSLYIPAGQRVGIVGASGAGKSTLVNLLLRLHDPEAGKISISSTDIRRVTQDSLRKNIGMVSQETSMFNRSAFDNIAYGRPGAATEDVQRAADQAQAHDFIETLVDNRGRTGYQAHLGERGVKLSGGQRQRIALARTLLKDAPILILDEATSALDSEVENAIQTTLETVMEGKTVLAIAHRLSTIARMDRIIVMDNGTIVEDGTHQKLLDQNGLYATYWNHQSGGFIGVDTAAQ